MVNVARSVNMARHRGAQGRVSQNDKREGREGGGSIAREGSEWLIVSGCV